GGIEVEDPALEFHGAPLFSRAARARARPCAFPGPAQSRAGSLPWDYRGTDRWPPACRSGRGERGGRKMAGLRGEERGGISSSARWGRGLVERMSERCGPWKFPLRKRAENRTREFFSDDGELVAFGDGESRNMVCLREELREKRFARRLK